MYGHGSEIITPHWSPQSMCIKILTLNSIIFDVIKDIVVDNQCVAVPKMLDDTATDTFSGTIYFRYRYRYFFRYQIFPIPVPKLFLIPNFTDTGSETFFRYQFFPIPFPIPPKKLKIPGTGTSHSDQQVWKV